MGNGQKYNGVFENWTVGRYIGGGGFGKVYELHRFEGGKDLKSALKVVSIPKSREEIDKKLEQGESEESIRQFYHGFADKLANECSIMAELKGNSNIVSYEDHKVVPHSNGIGRDIYIRMELLQPLAQYFMENDVTEEVIIELGKDICKALELCEKNNIIHRDIKPENIFHSKNGDFKIGDFGIAKTMEGTVMDMTRAGTSNYMAPEIYRGDRNYGKTVDIYSLGLVMYFFANGKRLPFLPPAPQALSYEDVNNALWRRMRGERLPAPRSVSSELAAVISKACAFNPNDRYANATEMRKALERIENSNTDPDPEPIPIHVDDEPSTVIDPPTEGELTIEDGLGQTPQAKTQPKKPLDTWMIITIAVAAVIAAAALIYFLVGNHDNSGYDDTDYDDSGNTALFDPDAPELMADTGVKGTLGDSHGMDKQSLMFGYFNRDDIHSIVFTDDIDDADGTVVDVSADQNEEALAWMSSQDPHVLYIGGEGGVKANSDCNGLFAYCENLKTIYFNNVFDTSNVTQMRYLFYHDENLLSVDMKNIDTSNVTMMDRMFGFCSSLEKIDNMNFDTSKVEDMSGMFNTCRNLKSVDTTGWDTSNVGSMLMMFQDCNNLTSVNTSGMYTGNVRDFRYMFYRCYDLTDLDVSEFNTSSGTNMYAMFSHCESLGDLDVSGFNTSNVSCMKYMFVSCKSAEIINVSGFDTSLLNGNQVYHIFYDCNPDAVKGYENWKEYNSSDSNDMFDL